MRCLHCLEKECVANQAYRLTIVNQDSMGRRQVIRRCMATTKDVWRYVEFWGFDEGQIESFSVVKTHF